MTDGLQFKSVLIRHVRYFFEVLRASPDAQNAIKSTGLDLATLRQYVRDNADSIWDTAACAAPVAATSPGTTLTTPAIFGDLWRGPCSWAFGGPTATSQTGALDVFMAADAM